MVEIRKRRWRIATWASLGVAAYLGHSDAFAEARESEQRVKVVGQVELSPVEPVRGLFVRVGRENHIWQTPLEQQTWPSPQFELELPEADDYRFEVIGVFVEPQDGAHDAYYTIFPKRPISFVQSEANFRLDQTLRPLRIRFEENAYSKFELSVESTGSAFSDEGVWLGEFLSTREWSLQETGPFEVTTWVLAGRYQDLSIRMIPAGDAGQELSWSRYSVSPDEDEVILHAPSLMETPLALDVAGNSVSMQSGQVHVHATWDAGPPSEPFRFRPFLFDVDVSGRSTFSIPRRQRKSFSIQPTLYFEDGSATTLNAEYLELEQDRPLERSVELVPQDLSVAVDASFPVERMRVSIARAPFLQAARATKEVEFGKEAGRVGERQTADLTLQLPKDASWGLDGLSVHHKRTLWMSRYRKSYGPESMYFSGPVLQRVEFGKVASLSLAEVSVEHVRALRGDAQVGESDQDIDFGNLVLRGETVQEVLDRRGWYTDTIHARGADFDVVGRAGFDVVGRAGHLYRLVVESEFGDQVADALDLTFGYPQSVQPGGPVFVGSSLSSKQRCARVEIMIPRVFTSGSFAINAFSAGPLTPLGYALWPEQPIQTRAFEVRRTAGILPSTRARVCLQFDQERLEQEGRASEDLTLAYRTRFVLGEAPCPSGQEQLGSGWCAMPMVDPQEMIFLLGQEPGCAWRCGEASAWQMQTLGWLVPEAP